MTNLDPCYTQLKQLFTLTNEAIDEAVKIRHKDLFKHEAINWADLGAVELSARLDDYGSFEYHVIVEEASPKADNLALFIRNYLLFKGLDVSVETRW